VQRKDILVIGQPEALYEAYVFRQQGVPAADGDRARLYRAITSVLGDSYEDGMRDLAKIDRARLPARDIVERSLNIAADICIYTNRNLTIEEL